MTLPLYSLVFGPPDDPSGDAVQARRTADGVRTSDTARRAADDPDAPLVERLRASDATALDALVDRYYARLVGFADSFVRDLAVAEDVVQDTLAALWERREALAVRTTFAAYLFTLVRNAALNARRAVQSRTRSLHAYAASRDALDDRPRMAAPDVDVERAEQERLLREAVDALASRYRDVIVLRAAGLTYDAIGEVLNLPTKTARTRGLRAIAMLRAALADKF